MRILRNLREAPLESRTQEGLSITFEVPAPSPAVISKLLADKPTRHLGAGELDPAVILRSQEGSEFTKVPALQFAISEVNAGRCQNSG